MARVKQIPPSPPLKKGGDAPAPGGAGCRRVGASSEIPTASLRLNDFEPHLKSYARDLRKRQTDAELHLWQHLRRDQLGVRFLRQRPLGRYIVDFYSPAAKLVIELDGGQHFEPEYQARDAERDAWLQTQGLVVLRFDDRQVLVETGAVLEAIFRAVREASGVEIPSSMTSPASPPFSKGGTSESSASPFATAANGETFESAASLLPPLQKGGGGGFSNVSIRRKR